VGSAIITINDLNKTYRVGGQVIKAVDHASLTVERGELLSIVGHSGSGKTTLLSLVGGLTRPDSGTVKINGTELWSISDNALSEFRNRRINFIYQFASLIPTLTVRENVMLPTAFGSWEGKEVEQRALELLDTVKLTDKVDSYPAELSGGQQRRVAIARAFINEPEIILADEPTGDLDEETEAEIMELFRRTNQEQGITFMIVTHSTELAKRTSRQLRMKDGVLADV